MRRTQFDLAKAKERAHILEGLKIAIDNIDEIIALIKASPSTDAAQTSSWNALRFRNCRPMPFWK